MNQSLEALYCKHTGKRSDKWSAYFDIYDKALAPYRKNNINLLEIGVQNGGSLEIWDEYFPEALKIMGCDINNDCEKLTYNSSKIKVLVENVNTDKAFNQITEYFDSGIDILIDDGSHDSGDIIKTFAKYFDCISEGGVFIAEDLHCSYWHDYKGGLYYPMSAIAFFKKLADCINHEHWGVLKSREEFLEEFSSHYSIALPDAILQQIHSVSFYNSVCIVEKKSAEKNILGKRFMAGQEQLVVALDELSVNSWCPQQNDNYWTNMPMSPEARYFSLVQEIESLSNTLSESEKKHDYLSKRYETSQLELMKKEDELKKVYNSLSWKVAKFFQIFKFWGSK